MVTSWYEQIVMTNGYDPFEESEVNPDDARDEQLFDDIR